MTKGRKGIIKVKLSKRQLENIVKEELSLFLEEKMMSADAKKAGMDHPDIVRAVKDLQNAEGEDAIKSATKKLGDALLANSQRLMKPDGKAGFLKKHSDQKRNLKDITQWLSHSATDIEKSPNPKIYLSRMMGDTSSELAAPRAGFQDYEEPVEQETDQIYAVAEAASFTFPIKTRGLLDDTPDEDLRGYKELLKVLEEPYELGQNPARIEGFKTALRRKRITTKSDYNKIIVAFTLASKKKDPLEFILEFLKYAP